MSLDCLFQQPAIRELEGEIRRIGRIGSALSLLGWDQETYMPPKGVNGRAGALGDLTEVVHRMATCDELGERIARAEAGLEEETDERAPAFLREVRRRYDRRRKVPPELAEQIARTSSQALAAWKEARSKDQFATFAPFLEKMLDLKRQEAEALGYSDHIYDALLEEYEPGMTTAQVQALCDHVRPVLLELIAEVAPKAESVRSDFLEDYAVGDQEKFCRAVVERLGFDFQRGRIDVTTHPFCSGIGPGDVRLTTRYAEEFLPQALFGLIHEAGHGLYEQGLDDAWSGTPLAAAVSTGFHESQSRLWENMVGRGRPFWEHFLPVMREHFPGRADDVTVDGMFRAVNRVKPSLIRVEADEVTYNLHIMLRFAIEKELMQGTLKVADLPGRWNELMGEFIGVVPEDDAEGVLQDIHWSFGGFGYFPTYFLGNVYGAQLYRAAEESIDDLPALLARGDFAPLLQWLRREVHLHGSRYPAPELCTRITGTALDPEPLCDYLKEKMALAFGV